VDFSSTPGTVRKPFLYRGDKLAFKKSAIFRVYGQSAIEREILPDIQANTEIVLAGSVEGMDSLYKRGLRILKDISNNSLPKFGNIKESYLPEWNLPDIRVNTVPLSTHRLL